MNLISKICAIAAAAMALSNAASAQYQTVYVSTTGSSTNNCTSPVQAPNSTFGPCSGFSSALEKVAEGSTIVCVNPGSYESTITITKSVTIDCLAGGGGENVGYVTINAPNKTVTLRNMAINPNGYVTSPIIDIVAAGSVRFENVMIAGSPGRAIYDHRTGPGRLSISNTIVRSNSGPAIVIVPQNGSTIFATLDNVAAQDSSYGLAVASGGRVMITRSTFSGNFSAGVEADPGAIIDIEDSLIAGNPVGIQAVAGSSVSLANSRINSNNTGISGATRSFGSNRLVANALSDGRAPTPVVNPSTENGQR